MLCYTCAYTHTHIHTQTHTHTHTHTQIRSAYLIIEKTTEFAAFLGSGDVIIAGPWDETTVMDHLIKVIVESTFSSEFDLNWQP